MGGCVPKALQFDSQLRADVLEKHADLQRALALTDAETWTLYQAFADANVSEAGVLSEEEWHAFLDTGEGAVARRVFRLYKDDPAGVTFRSWLIACWSICTRDSENLINFAFQIYDVKGRGELGLADVNLLLAEIFGVGFENDDVPAAIYKRMVRVDYRGTALDAHVTIDAFVPLARKSPLLCHPAFKLQTKLCDRTLGPKGWEVVTRRRDNLVKSGSFDVSAIVSAANDSRTRGRSLVPLDPRHIVPLRSALGPTKSMLDYLPGLRTSTRVTPEGDYKEVREKIDAALQAEEDEAAMEAAARASMEATMAFVADAKADPKAAVRRASVAAAQGAVAALGLARQALDTSLSKATGALVEMASPSPAHAESRRRLPEAAQPPVVRNLDVSPTLDASDSALTSLAAYKARRSSVSVEVRDGGVHTGGGRRASGTGRTLVKLDPKAEGEGVGVEGEGEGGRGEDAARVPSSTAGASTSTSASTLRSLPAIRTVAAESEGFALGGANTGSDAPEGRLPMAPRRASNEADTRAQRMPKRASVTGGQAGAVDPLSPAGLAAQRRRQSALMTQAVRRASQLN